VEGFGFAPVHPCRGIWRWVFIMTGAVRLDDRKVVLVCSGGCDGLRLKLLSPGRANRGFGKHRHCGASVVSSAKSVLKSSPPSPSNGPTVKPKRADEILHLKQESALLNTRVLNPYPARRRQPSNQWKSQRPQASTHRTSSPTTLKRVKIERRQFALRQLQTKPTTLVR